MEYVIVAFRSRAHTIRFANVFKESGFALEIVNTPKEAGVGCGLSVKIRKESFLSAKKMVLKLALSSFAGFFLVSEFNNKRIVRTI